jgi:hypothetical protein
MMEYSILLCASTVVTNGTVASFSVVYFNSYDYDLVTCFNPVIRSSGLKKKYRKIQHYTINIYIVACDWVMSSHSPYMLA